MRKKVEVKLMFHVARLKREKEARDDRSYTGTQIAKATGLSEIMVSRMLNNQNVDSIGVGKIVLMALWLGVKVDDMFTVEGSTPPAAPEVQS